MEVSKQLKKQIIIEIFALIFLIGVIIYAIFAINVSEKNRINSQDGMVLVLDSTNNKKLSILSNGEGLSREGSTYTITNNNDKEIKYKVIINPNTTDEDILKHIVVGIDDIYVKKLNDLERYQGGYVVSEMELGAGYTKVHLFKYWLAYDSPNSLTNKEIYFEYDVVTE